MPTRTTPSTITLREARALWREWRSMDVRQALETYTNEAPPGVTLSEVDETDTFSVHRTIEQGIERVTVVPRKARFETPILMQHGMWHGAWCWRPWQELFAKWGWESHAYSLPGHAGSPVQRVIRDCTLDYYLGFLKLEVERLPRCPVVMGHSMGGALTQWYLKYVGALPAAVLVGSWVAHNELRDVVPRVLGLDPWGLALVCRDATATPLIRTARRAARMFVTDGAALSPHELHARLGPESVLVVWQHQPPVWRPPDALETPLLWLDGAKDVLISRAGARRSAAHYGAAYVRVAGAGHNIMMEKSYRQTAELVHTWLVDRLEPR